MKSSLLFFSLLCVSLLFGCSAFAPKTTAELVKAVQRYCVLPQSDRLLARGQANTELAAANIKICVDCPGAGDECAP